MSYSLPTALVAQYRALALATDIPAARIVQRAMEKEAADRLARLTSDERRAYEAALTSTTDAP